MSALWTAKIIKAVTFALFIMAWGFLIGIGFWLCHKLTNHIDDKLEDAATRKRAAQANKIADPIIAAFNDEFGPTEQLPDNKQEQLV